MKRICVFQSAWSGDDRLWITRQSRVDIRLRETGPMVAFRIPCPRLRGCSMAGREIDVTYSRVSSGYCEAIAE